MSRDMLVQAFERIVRAQGSEPLVLSPSRASTAADIDALARAVAATLRRAGLEPGSLVGLVAPNGPAFLASLLALRHADCPALLFDWRTPAAELERIGRALGATAVLRFATAWPAGAAEASLAAIERDEAAGTSVPGPGAFDSAAIVQLTSGSTGEPQGILKTMESVMIDDRALAASMSLSRDERILAAIPMSHAYGLSSVAMPALTRGCCLVVPDEGNPLGTMHAAQVGDVTFLPTVPAYLQALLRMTAPPPLPASLRLVITAGAPLHPETAARFRQTYDRPVHVFYGASEVGGICFDRAGDAAERGTLGTPVEGVQITLAEAPGADEPGVGAVVVASGAVALGYLPQPDPCLGGGRFRSSDLGALCDGELVLRGRIDDLINVKGKKVRPGEVEAVLRRLDAVDDAIVLGLGAADGGQMVRAVVAGERSRLQVQTVLIWCREHLAAHKVPRGVVLVDEIPRTARGKVDRAAVRALAAGTDGPDLG